jgi:hypothetical protein
VFVDDDPDEVVVVDEPAPVSVLVVSSVVFFVLASLSMFPQEVKITI